MYTPYILRAPPLLNPNCFRACASTRPISFTEDGTGCRIILSADVAGAAAAQTVVGPNQPAFGVGDSPYQVLSVSICACALAGTLSAAGLEMALVRAGRLRRHCRECVAVFPIGFGISSRLRRHRFNRPSQLGATLAFSVVLSSTIELLQNSCQVGIDVLTTTGQQSVLCYVLCLAYSSRACRESSACGACTDWMGPLALYAVLYLAVASGIISTLEGGANLSNCDATYPVIIGDCHPGSSKVSAAIIKPPTKRSSSVRPVRISVARLASANESQAEQRCRRTTGL
jgi:hypothetical protein